MSGGHFCCADSRLKSELFGFVDSPIDVFDDMEISGLVWDLLELIHVYDWYLSVDTGREDYLKAKAEFKEEWLGDRSERMKRIVDDAIQQTKNELYETFGVKEE